jgi:putative intracellular protease/amidase/heme-degrading monooxygenase HmoA
MRIDIVVFDGLDELDALGPWEVFRCAQRLGARLTARLVTRDERREVTGSNGLRFVADAAYDESAPADWLLVPGGNWMTRAEKGAFAEARAGHLPALLQRARANGVRLASVCTGAMLLAEAGLLKGRPATTHASAHAELEASGAVLRRERVVDDGDLVTAGGVASGLDLAVHLVARIASQDLADKVVQHLELNLAAPAPAPPALSPLMPKGSYAVIFASTRNAQPDDGYGVTADAMVALAQEQPGFLGLDSARGADGLGITVSYWKDEESIRTFRRLESHLVAQRAGREGFYRGYRLSVAKVERSYGFESGEMLNREGRPDRS